MINKLRRLLDEVAQDYDRVYIDTPPAMNFYAFSALIAADSVLIPFDCETGQFVDLLNVLEEANWISSAQSDLPAATAMPTDGAGAEKF